MEQNIVNNFGLFLSSLKIPSEKKDKIIQFFINSIKENELIKKVGDTSFYEYCDQIIEMISNNQDCSKQTFRDYIAMVFGKVQKKTKFIKIN